MEDARDKPHSILYHDHPRDIQQVYQMDEHNCGIRTLLTMIKRYQGGTGFLKEQLNKRELEDCRVRIFNIIYQVFKVIIPTNNFEHNWSDVGSVRDDRYWRNNFLQSNIED